MGRRRRRRRRQYEYATQNEPQPVRKGVEISHYSRPFPKPVQAKAEDLPATIARQAKAPWGNLLEKLSWPTTDGPIKQGVYANPMPIQPKLTVGAVGDKYEQEADAVAAQVVQQLNSPPVQRQEYEDEKADSLQRQSIVQSIQRTGTSAGGTASPELEQSIQQKRGKGRPLADRVRQPMEDAFGTNFGGVRIHTDNTADQLNQSIQAKAFTTGQDVFFRQGAYAPESKEGQGLLAHELTHVVQQEKTETIQRSVGFEFELHGNQVRTYKKKGWLSSEKDAYNAHIKGERLFQGSNKMWYVEADGLADGSSMEIITKEFGTKEGDQDKFEETFISISKLLFEVEASKPWEYISMGNFASFGNVEKDMFYMVIEAIQNGRLRIKPQFTAGLKLNQWNELMSKEITLGDEEWNMYMHGMPNSISMQISAKPEANNPHLVAINRAVDSCYHKYFGTVEGMEEAKPIIAQIASFIIGGSAENEPGGISTDGGVMSAKTVVQTGFLQKTDLGAMLKHLEEDVQGGKKIMTKNPAYFYSFIENVVKTAWGRSINRKDPVIGRRLYTGQVSYAARMAQSPIKLSIWEWVDRLASSYTDCLTKEELKKFVSFSPTAAVAEEEVKPIGVLGDKMDIGAGGEKLPIMEYRAMPFISVRDVFPWAQFIYNMVRAYDLKDDKGKSKEEKK
ncbi:MAG: DUF4157 domain-containing protein [Spirulina sp. SIO3F2]|nr:DUF4157 domain-containing protein [Spirulina sp. SIO3F2]